MIGQKQEDCAYYFSILTLTALLSFCASTSMDDKGLSDSGCENIVQ